MYDGLGRRVQTSWQPDNSGVPNGSPTPLAYYYDPQVEFLELGLNDNGDRTWWVYGPDRSGVYGGAQGEGGVENEIDEAGGFAYVPINNYFGDALGASYVPTVDNPGYSITYGYGSALGGYGYEPGSAVYTLSLQWRGQYLDWTGFICQGARYYDYESGRFLSADPLGNAASMSLYDYCSGDPVNGLDPDGRCVEGPANQTVYGPAAPPQPNPTPTTSPTAPITSNPNGAVAQPLPAPDQATIDGWVFTPPWKQAVGTGVAVTSLIFGGPASYEGVNGGTDYAGFTNTSALPQSQQLQNNQNLSNATGAITVAAGAMVSAYQAPVVTAPGPAGNPGPIQLQDGDVILAVIQNGQIIATSTPALSHAELVARQFGGEVPQGAEVVTIVKANGQVTAITSMTYSGTQVPASAAAQAAAKAAYQ